MPQTIGSVTKQPELLSHIVELRKAVETVQQSADELCNLLKVGINESPTSVNEAPMPILPLIRERCMSLSDLRADIYSTDERLRLVLEALQEL